MGSAARRPYNRNIHIYDWQRAGVSYITGSYRRYILACEIRSQRDQQSEDSMGCVPNREGAWTAVPHYTTVGHARLYSMEYRHDGVQQYHYTESTVPVRDCTARYRDRASRRSTGRCEFVPQYTGAYAVVRHKECRHDGVQQMPIYMGTVPVRDRDRTARKSACRYDFVPQYTRAYAVVQHDKCRHDGVQQYKNTKSIVPVRDRTAMSRVRERRARVRARTMSAAVTP